MYSEEKIYDVLGTIQNQSKPKPYFAICQPRRDASETPAQDFAGQYGGTFPLALENYSHTFLQVSGQPVDVARNMLLQAAVDRDAKYAFFIGEDTVLPFYAFQELHRLAEANPDAVISGVYYFKCGGPMIMIRDEENRQCLADVTPGKMIENPLLCGLDVMLIPTAILKKMQENEPDTPFTCVFPGNEEIRFVGEDDFFLTRLYRNGFRVLITTDVQCLHMDLATGNYTAHPDVVLEDYNTCIPIGRPLAYRDKHYIDKRWSDRMPKPDYLIEENIEA
jgi:hypothetical protein